MKFKITGLFSFVASLLTLALFVLACWTAAADAQGAIALFIMIPIFIGLLVAGYFLGRYSAKSSKIGLFGKRFSQGVSILLVIFYLSTFLGISSVSTGVIGIIADAFKAATGKSPYEYDKNL